MGVAFEVTDPRGRTVVCTEERWNEHVTSHHSCLKGLIDYAANAIREPLYIFSDAIFADRENYYYRPSPYGFYLKVVVKFADNNKGTVVTATPVDGLKPGESEIWSFLSH